MADLLLNFRCNAQLPKHPPYAKTCCNEYPWPNWIQILGFLFIVAMMPTALLLHKRRPAGSVANNFLCFMPHPKYYGSILVTGTVLFLGWYCDRTNIFGKEPKQTSPGLFFLLIGLAVALSSFFATHTAEIELSFLNRDQTDEWKGW